MTVSLADIHSDPISRAVRQILLGHEKVGKSTFAAGSPAPIFVTVQGEEGLDALNVSRFPPADSFDQVIGARHQILPGQFGQFTLGSSGGREDLRRPTQHRSICSLTGFGNRPNLGARH